MPSDAKAQMRGLLRKLADAGCAAETNGSGHVKVRRGDKTLTIATTPSDHRAVMNAYAEARRVLGVPVYFKDPPKKRKESVDDHKMARIRERVEKLQGRGVGVTDLARLTIAVAADRGIPTWKNVHSATEGISSMMKHGERRLTKVRHDSLASALNRIDGADDAALKWHLEWAAEKLGVKRISGHVHGPARAAAPRPPLRIAPPPPAAPPAGARAEAEEDAATLTVNVELGPATRALIRELLRTVTG